MAGRRPKPTALRLIEGNPGKRAINKKEPNPRKEIPSCPAHLTDAGKVAWGRLCALLDRMGVLTEADAFALERLCDCYTEILECRELIEVQGRTYDSARKSKDGDMEILIKANPAVAMLADADRRFKSHLVQFGLTPAARSKVQVKDDGDQKQDPLQEFFG